MRYYLPRAYTYNMISSDLPAAAMDGLKQALLAGMNAESDWGVGTAAGPLVRWFEYSHGNVGGGKTWALEQLDNLVPGKPSPFFEALDNATQDGAVLVRGTGEPTNLAYIEGYVDPEWQDPSRMALVVAAGGDVEGVQVVFELDDITTICPFGDGVETWETWGTFGESHVPVQIVDKWYRTSCVGASGEPLLASEWIGYYLTGGVVISTAQFQAIQEANQSEP